MTFDRITLDDNGIGSTRLGKGGGRCGRRRGTLARFAAALLLATCVSAPLTAAWAQEEPFAAPSPREEESPSEPSIASSLPPWLGTTFGLRPWLASMGITYQVNQISEGWRNSQGGEKLGNTYVGRTELAIETDLEKLIGWKGGSTHVNGYWIQGHGLSGYYVGNILAVSNIEALPTVRLFEAWFEQKLSSMTIRRSASASSPPTPNSSPASTRGCSSTARSGGRASPQPTCPAAGLPIRWRRPRCG